MQLEMQQDGLAGFVRGCLATAWLEYRNLRYHLSNLWLAAIQQVAAIGVWYFVSQFLSTAANHAVQTYGGNYVAFVVIGVLFNQIGMTALTAPFTTVSEAFWDKRLETYRLSIQGIWANVVGRLAWQVLFSTVLQAFVLIVILLLGGVSFGANIHVGLLVLGFILFVGANAGLGIMGASLFFLLDIKSGQDPITWLYRYLVMIVSGLYVPLTILPGWLKGVGKVLPQTYGFEMMRSTLLTGAGWNSSAILTSLLPLAAATVITVAGGYLMLRFALRRAEQKGGIGVVV